MVARLTRGRLTSGHLLDAGLALAVTGAAVAELWVPFESVQGEGSRAASTVMVLLMCLALTFRRSHPLTTAVLSITPIVLASLVAPTYVLFWGGLVPICIALYSVARYGRGRQPFLGAGIGAATMLLADLTEDALQSPSEIVFHWTVLTLTWSAGYSLQVKEHRAEASMQRAVDAEVTAAAQVMSAVIEERTRIARELHDIVAHSVSTIVVQAGAARQVVEDDPAHVASALDAIRDTGAEALADMRRAVAVLRDDDELGALSPQPGVAALPGLVDDTSCEDLQVTLRTVGELRGLSPGLDLAVYRIVQESLTNVRRHARASRAEVRLTYSADLLMLEVCDDGRGAGRNTRGSGHGLVGMRERVALYGGRLEARQPAGGSGFVVRAELPLNPTAPQVEVG